MEKREVDSEVVTEADDDYDDSIEIDEFDPIINKGFCKLKNLPPFCFVILKKIHKTKLQDRKIKRNIRQKHFIISKTYNHLT